MNVSERCEDSLPVSDRSVSQGAVLPLELVIVVGAVAALAGRVPERTESATRTFHPMLGLGVFMIRLNLINLIKIRSMYVFQVFLSR